MQAPDWCAGEQLRQPEEIARLARLGGRARSWPVFNGLLREEPRHEGTGRLHRL